ncbi:hypothetical protein [Bdellovibrio sp. HCB337]|uniref:hypothetical protein n=1 Tax=Bdellovibrio sp. HCB337 TaxID=3394358 RepID=UPI0039A6A919
MLKHILVSSLMFLSASAALACEGEAQVIAKIENTKFHLSSGCKVTLTEVRHFSENQLCPLSLSEVNTAGLSIGVVNGHECAASPGDEISGVIEKHGDLYILN